MPAHRSRLVPTSANGVLAEALEALKSSLELPGEFSPDVLDEAEKAAHSVSADPNAAGIADLRDIEFLTIDPAGSMDLDQAMHIERTASGAVLHYAIADVPAFVEFGGAIDAEARERGQTYYSATGRIPLHPPVLSEDAASLLPEVDRRAFVWRFVLDDGARPTETTLTRAVVRSRRKWTYPEAQAAVTDGSAPETLQALEWFGAQRAERESERGGASLNMPETSIAPENGGYRLEREAPLPIEGWNAHVSLLTGMAAADIMLRGGVGILRTMPEADPDDIATFRAQTVALGMPWREGVGYGEYLRTLDAANPAALAVREAAASLFRGAGYVAFDGQTPSETMQVAIGAPYAHTTAPLRRLVDRWVLVICEALANEHPVPQEARDSLKDLPEIMMRTNRLASQLEAGSIDRVEAAILTGREGDVFPAVVLRTLEDAARVQVTDPPVTAKVAGLAAPAGSAVELRLEKADIASGVVDFAQVGVAAGR